MSICQTFNVRIDVTEELQAETGFAVEGHSNGYLALLGTWLSDGSHAIGTQVVGQNGDILASQIISDSVAHLYPGLYNSLDNTIGGGYVFAGSSASVSSDSSGIILCKLEQDGSLQWKVNLENLSSSVEIGASAKQVGDGGFIVAATYETESGHTNGLLVKTDEDGLELWRTSWGSNDENDKFTQVTEIAGSGFAVGGSSETEGGNDLDMLVTKFDYDGNEEWHYVYDNDFDDVAAQVAVGNSGEILFCGQHATTIQNGGVNLVGQLDSSGNELWTMQLGIPGSENIFRNVKQQDNGDIIAVGGAVIPGVENAGIICKLNSAGDSLWCRSLYNIFNDHCFLHDVVFNEDGGYTAVGWTFPNVEEGLSQDGWLVRTDEFGCVIPGCHVGLAEMNWDSHFNVFPNPFTDELIVILNDPLSSQYHKISIYDIQGVLVKSIAANWANSSQNLSVASLPAGTYFIKLESDGIQFQGQKLLKLW